MKRKNDKFFVIYKIMLVVIFSPAVLFLSAQGAPLVTYMQLHLNSSDLSDFLYFTTFNTSADSLVFEALICWEEESSCSKSFREASREAILSLASWAS